jgi:hypothetical protein
MDLTTLFELYAALGLYGCEKIYVSSREDQDCSGLNGEKNI